MAGRKSSKTRTSADRTITEFLSGKGLERGIALEGGKHYPIRSILHVEGGRKFEIGRMIAQGGMGVVYEARDMNCRRTVAMKILPHDLPCKSEDLLRFIEEAQVTSQLEHPNIVPIHELGLDKDGNVYYVMKYVKGVTLTEVLVGLRNGDKDFIGQYPLSRLLNILQKACDAVAFAHSKGVVHRDIKPDNIMIGDFGEVVVMDWGLAKIVGQMRAGQGAVNPQTSVPEAVVTDTSPGEPLPEPPAGGISSIRTDDIGSGLRTMSGRVMGTPGFMAPEQIMAGGEQVDQRSDIYSLGATLYSILTLRPSIQGKDLKDILEKICAGEVHPPSDFNAPAAGETASGARPDLVFPHCPDGRIPDTLSGIVMKAMALDPRNRHASVLEFQHDIEAYQDGLIWHLVTDDDFSGPEALAHWEVIGGRHEIREGELRLSNGMPQVLLLKRDLGGDIRIEFDCCQDGAYLNTIGCFISAFRSRQGQEIPSSGYEFKLGGYDNSLNVLMRSDRKLWTQSASSIGRSVRYHVIAERVGSRLRMVVNGREVFCVHDPDPLSGGERTAVGLAGWIAETSYSRVRVYSLGTPWKLDMIEMAERELQKGDYLVAKALFKEVIESFPDAGRLERARRGHAAAASRQDMLERLPTWRETLERIWPGSGVEVRMENEGLTVEVPRAGITDLEPLRGMPLTKLHCPFNRIADIEPLRGMPLRTLNISANPVETLEPLRGIQLETLICECCRLESLEPIRGMPMTLLNCGGNRIADLDPIRGMQLTFLGCWGNRITSLEPARGMPLTMIYAGGNQIDSLAPLAGMPLNTLHCGGNRVTSLEPLRGVQISFLHCADNQITDLEPLRGMSIMILSCHANRIRTLAPLRDVRLGVLTCGANEFTNIDPYLEEPPEDFLFESDSMPLDVVEAIRDRWKRQIGLEDHIANLDVLIALRKRDVPLLKQMAKPFEGRRYLFIPKALRWVEAKKLCEELGGHLVTIMSQAENDHVQALFVRGSWCWIGLEPKDDGYVWVTGEPLAYRNFVDPLAELKPGPKVFSGKWHADDVAHGHNPFVIEWDR